MFFIGGFGTILPYLIYISLVWVFILVGFNGKIGSLLSFSEQPEEIFTSPDDQESITENVYVVGKDTPSEQKSGKTALHNFRFSIKVRSFNKLILYEYSKDYTARIQFSSHFERGPPIQFS